MRQNVCVDLDGVLAQYDRWRGISWFGEPLPGAVDFTHQLGQFARVVIYTCRVKGDGPGRNDNPEELVKLVRSWLTRHGFYWDEIYIGQGKPVAAAYVDDRAISCRPQEDSSAFHYTLPLIKQLIKGAH